MKQIEYKNIVYSFIVVILLCTSCAPSTKIVINGNSGTEIYNSEYKKLGTIPNKGKVKIKLPKNEFVPFLLAHEANGTLYVPFAVDYRHKGHGTENTIAFLGLFSGIGTLPSVIYWCSRGSSQYWNDYKYNKEQTTNQDLVFTSFIDEGENKQLISEDEVSVSKSNKRIKAVNDVKPSNTSNYSVSKRTLSNYGKLLSGTYTGTGYLTQSGKTIEEYASIKVIITRIDNSNVWIDVVESGEPFFSSKSKYQITKKGKNTYVLSLKGISDAYITIDSNGALTYMHPKVNIDGELYTLNINAKKK